MLTKGAGSFAAIINSGMSYLLRAFTSDTGASDQGYSNAQVLDTAAEGVLDSSGTVNETDGTLALASTKLTVTAQSTPAWGDCGIVFAQRTGQQGKAFMLTVNSADYAKLFMAGWGGNGLALANVMLGFQLQTDKKIDFVSNGAVTATDLVTLTNSADASFVFIPGGYDSNGVPFDTSKAIADYTYGGSLYWWNGSNWLLVWRTSAVACSSKEYPLLSFYDMAGTVENVLIPDYDFSAVLQPILLDTFTDTDGTALADHTPDVCPVGSAWEGGALWKILSNKAAFVSGHEMVYATKAIETGLADVFIQAALSVNPRYVGLCCRYLDYDSVWVISYDYSIHNLSIIECHNGTNTVRASNSSVGTQLSFVLNVVCKGATITAISPELAGGSTSYASATFNQTLTRHGIGWVYSNVHSRCDNFAVYPLTSTTIDAEFAKAGYNY